MNKFVPIALLATVATLAVVPAAVFAAESNQQVREVSGAQASGASISVGKSLYGPDGKRIAQVYRVTSTGDVQIILSAKLITVPAASLSEANGKVSTSIAKSELNRR